MNIYSQIKYEEMTPDFQFLADSCGIEIAQTILENFGGLVFYVPKITTHKEYLIRLYKETRPKSIKEFSHNINVSENFIRSILKQ